MPRNFPVFPVFQKKSSRGLAMSNTFICILPQASLSSMNFNAVYIEKGLLQVAKFRYAQEARFLFSYFIFCFLLHALSSSFLPGIHDNNK